MKDLSSKSLLAALSVSTAFVVSACAGEITKPASSEADPSAHVTAAPTLFDQALSASKARIDAQIGAPVNVPVPQDAGGGFTHEQHKRNAKAIYEAGLLYDATGDEKYRDHAVHLLEAYAELYPGLGEHPKKKEQTPGRLFWQSLNEAWWLVYTIQGYDLIQKSITDEQRSNIEGNILRPVADFLSEGQPQTFNKVHNHGTWATAAVGMTGYVLDDQDYVEKSLLGLDLSGTGGFLRQLDELFSPDGYYNEGPYYQRFALMPFVLFGEAIEANEPERKIFERRDGILQKAILSTIHQNYAGLFFPINDAIKDKGIATTELLYGVSIAYDLTKDPALLSVAEAQGRVVPTAAGQRLAADLAAGKAEPFPYQSMRLADGQNGTDGALDILRASDDPNGFAVVAKNTSQGLGHGHFDKMGLLVFDEGEEILRDYGAARFLNIEAKYGGHYLPENNLYAKQTIAHNALVLDQSSHFGGVTEEGNKHAPALGTFYASDNITATSATIDTAYPGVVMGRSLALISDPALEAPVLIDLVSAQSDALHDYDLPFHYNGQLVETNYTIDADTAARTPLGTQAGYQYLWKVGEAELPNDLAQTTILKNHRFYSFTSAVPTGSHLILAELGANDPDFNLRREPAMILRLPRARRASVATIIEPHGEYNGTDEYTLASHSQIARVENFESAADGGASANLIRLYLKSGDVISVGLSGSADEGATHSISADGQEVSWTGPYAVFPSE